MYQFRNEPSIFVSFFRLLPDLPKPAPNSEEAGTSVRGGGGTTANSGQLLGKAAGIDGNGRQ